MPLRHICHISDIHIRPGHETQHDELSARYDEYASVFQRITMFLQQRQQQQQQCWTRSDGEGEGDGNGDGSEMIIVITGDLVHDNRKIGALGIRLFNEIVGGLAGCAPVYIIRGNHDYNQAATHRDQDLLGSLVAGLPKCRFPVVYWNETAVHHVGGVAFGVLAIQDVLRPGNTSSAVLGTQATECGVADLLPPATADAACGSGHAVALYHGDVRHLSLEAVRGKGYGYLMLGDIHQPESGGGPVQRFPSCLSSSADVFEVSRTARGGDGQVLWAYAGSAVQQNFGEALLGHGFRIWDLHAGTSTLFHVRNDFGFVTVGHGEEAHHHQCAPWFPKFVRLRAPAGHRAAAALAHRGATVLARRRTTTEQASSGIGAAVAACVGGQLDVGMRPADWIEYIDSVSSRQQRQNGEGDVLSTVSWRTWLLAPETMLKDLLSGEVDLERARKRLAKAISDYTDASRHGVHRSTSAFRLEWLEWSYILCYGEGNRFDFGALDGEVHCISGKNGQGKTSFLETICVALFGQGFPSRTTAKNRASFISQALPERRRATTCVVFQVDDMRFEVRRAFKPGGQAQEVTVVEVGSTEGAPRREVASGKRATDEWLGQKLGTIEAFLTSCILTQGGDQDFFDKSASEQKAYIEAQLGLSQSTHMLTLLKSALLVCGETEKALEHTINAKRRSPCLLSAAAEDAALARCEATLSALSQQHQSLTSGAFMAVSHPIFADLIAHAQAHGLSAADLVMAAGRGDEVDAAGQMETTRCELRQVTEALARTDDGSFTPTFDPALERPQCLPSITAAAYDLWRTELEAHRERWSSRPPPPEQWHRQQHGDGYRAPPPVAPLDPALWDVDTEVLQRLLVVRQTLQANRSLYTKVHCELNPECPVCMANPLKQKQDALLAESAALQADEAALTQLLAPSVASLLPEDPAQLSDLLVLVRSHHAHLASEYARWQALEAQADEQEQQRVARDRLQRWLDNDRARVVCELRARQAELQELLRQQETAEPRRQLRSKAAALAATLEAEARQHQVERGMLQQRRADRTHMLRDIEALEGEHARVLKAQAALEAVLSHFGTYKDWVLEHKVLPQLQHRVNELLASLCRNHRPIQLACHAETFTWYIRDFGREPLLEKISGYQRFAVSMAMRLVLGNLGFAGLRNRQLFIDEGFTACDADNLRAVPPLLDELLSLYDSVVVVTHLEELKASIMSHVQIQSVSGLSALRFPPHDDSSNSSMCESTHMPHF